jgi:hypothetical protein
MGGQIGPVFFRRPLTQDETRGRFFVVALGFSVRCGTSAMLRVKTSNPLNSNWANVVSPAADGVMLMRWIFIEG